MALKRLDNVTYNGPDYGPVHDTGLWEDLRFPAQGINPAGSSAPPDVEALTGMLAFDNSADNMVGGVAQMPHSWKSGTAIEPHVHVYADKATNPDTAIDSDTDGACADHTGPTYTFTGTGVGTACANSKCVRILDTGSGAHGVAGNYTVSSVNGADSIELTEDPTDGTDETGMGWAVYANQVRLVLYYKVVAVGESWDQTSFTSITDTYMLSGLTDGGTRAVNQMLEFGPIDMTGYQDSCIIHWIFSRDANHAQDTYTNDLLLAEFDIHFRQNTLGSVSEHGDNF